MLSSRVVIYVKGREQWPATLFIIHRHPLIGPLQSIEHIYEHSYYRYKGKTLTFGRFSDNNDDEYFSDIESESVQISESARKHQEKASSSAANEQETLFKRLSNTRWFFGTPGTEPPEYRTVVEQMGDEMEVYSSVNFADKMMSKFNKSQCNQGKSNGNYITDF